MPNRDRGESTTTHAVPSSGEKRAQVVALFSSIGNHAVARALGGARELGSARGRAALMRALAYTTQPLVKQVAVPAPGPGPPLPPVTLNGLRPSQVRGPVHPTAVPARAATATPLAYIQTPAGGFPAVNRLVGYDGGHVIGLHLGGENDSRNVVPMFPLFNRGPWKNMEDRLKNYILSNPRNSYRMTVTMTYATAADEVPVTLDVTLEVEGPPGTWTQVQASQHNQPADIPQTPGLGAAEQQAVTGAVPAAAISYFHFSGNDFDTEGMGLTDYVNAKGYMPRSNKAHYPDNPNARPYGRLDVLALNGELTSRGLMTVATGMSAFRDFSADQRQLILQTNMAKHGGQLVSDDPADPHPTLNERGAADAPEVDHIVPKVRGGSNYFSNARVISWELNNRQDRVKPLTGLVDLGRLRKPPLTGTAKQKAVVIVQQALARFTGPQLTVDGIWQWAAQTWVLPQTPGRAATQSEAIRAELDVFVTDGILTEAGGTYTVV